MVLNNVSGAGNYYSPHYSPSGLGKASAVNANPASGSSASTTASPTLSANPVTLSNAAQALQGQNGDSAGSTDFAQEQQLLTTLTDKSLAALGIVSTADEANTQISFSSLSYDVSSSATASVSQQGQQSSAQIGDTQDATLVGQGEITTADGTQYAFQIELQVGDSEQASATSDSGNANASTNTNTNTSASPSTNANSGTNAAASAVSSQQPSNLLAQLVNALSQSGSSSSASGSNASNNFLTGNNGASAPTSGTSQSGQSASPSSGINWNAILNQTASLFDLLDSMATSSQTPASATSSQTPVSTAS
jgi:hypothetical protein